MIEKLLFVDTETTGLQPITDRIVSIAWAITDLGFDILEEEYHICHPTDVLIMNEHIHGISDAQARDVGIPESSAVWTFLKETPCVAALAGHNIDFDLAFIVAAARRAGFEEERTHHTRTLPRICTMKTPAVIEFCALPGRNDLNGFKYPKLEELHLALFGKTFENPHHALADVHATIDCLRELVKRDLVKLPVP